MVRDKVGRDDRRIGVIGIANTTHRTITDSVLEFWFERDTVPGYREVRPVWFASTSAFDAEIAEWFGRFPHRNAALGRPSTDEETAFLTGSDGSFWE